MTVTDSPTTTDQVWSVTEQSTTSTSTWLDSGRPTG